MIPMQFQIQLSPSNGFDTSVQGTVVQEDPSPRRRLDILVKGDLCPRKLLIVRNLLKLIFNTSSEN